MHSTLKLTYYQNNPRIEKTPMPVRIFLLFSLCFQFYMVTNADKIAFSSRNVALISFNYLNVIVTDCTI